MPVRTLLVQTLVVAAAGATLALVPTAPAAATTEDEVALAERFAPVMAMVRQDESCGPGDPYQPSAVDPLFGDQTVALRGPWADRDLVDVGPTAEELGVGLPGYALDYPPNPLQPGCSYESWATGVWGTDAEPTIYAHVATQAGHEGRLALQYYFFYPFNDYNNKHEGDWERIQLEFDAVDAAAALDRQPVRAVYSQHYGAEAAPWGDERIEVVDGTHPVVYVSAGSHASQFEEGLYLGNSASTGFGCDTTVGPHDRLEPTVATIPSDPEAAAEQFPWITYRGHWGEVGPRRFYEGPTGPNMKSAWRKPFSWSASARDTSYPVPGAQAAGSTGTGFFCAAVTRGSDVFRRWVDDPLPLLGLLALGVVVAAWAVRRTSWDVAAVPVRRRRRAGEVVGATRGVLRDHRWLLVRMAALPSALLVVGAVLQTLADAMAVPWLLRAVLGVAGLLAMIAFSGAVTQVLLALDRGEAPRARAAYGAAARRLPAAVVTVGLTVLIAALLGSTLVLAPLAVLVLLGSALVNPVVQVEGRWGPRGLWRALVLARRSWRTLTPLVVLALLTSLLLGLLMAALVFIVLTAPFTVVNAVPALVGALVWPFAALLLSYAYFSAASESTASRPGPAVAAP